MINKNKYVYKHSPNTWALELMQKHEALHWLPEEVPMLDDVRDWNKKLSHSDRVFVQEIMFFFVQADIEVHSTYLDEYMRYYPDDLYHRMMLSSFAGRENMHVVGYSHLIDTLGMPADTYSKFMDDPTLLSIHNILNKYTDTTVEGRFKRMVATTLMGEGVMLFAQFAMLLNFQRFGTMNGMGTIISWSIRDEDLHVQGIARLMREDAEFCKEAQADILRWYNEVKEPMLAAIKEFAKNCFIAGAPKGITLEEVDLFLDYQTARRARQAGIHDEPLPINPFLWFDQLVGGVENGNFFERTITEYSKGNYTGEWADGLGV